MKVLYKVNRCSYCPTCPLLENNGECLCVRCTQVMLPGVVVHAANRIINCIQCSSITSPMQLEISRMQNRQCILSMGSMRSGFVACDKMRADFFWTFAYGGRGKLNTCPFR